jgi:hypothetical protein
MQRLLLCVALVLIPAIAWAAAGTATKTETTPFAVKKIVWSWTSGTAGEGGTVTSATTASFTGKIIGLTTDPGATAPTDNWDVTITDSAGHDVLLGAGADRDTANTENVASASLGAVAGSPLTLNITNAGDAKTGVVILWIQ